MVLYGICGTLAFMIAILVYTSAGSPFPMSGTRKICIFCFVIVLFVGLIFSREVNSVKVSSEKKIEYDLNLVDEMCLGVDYDFNNIYVYKIENRASGSKTEYMFWLTDENGKRIFFKTNDVTIVEKQDCKPLVIEHIFEYEYSYERTDFLRAFGASDDFIPMRRTYELLVPTEGIYTIN